MENYTSWKLIICYYGIHHRHEGWQENIALYNKQVIRREMKNMYVIAAYTLDEVDSKRQF